MSDEGPSIDDFDALLRLAREDPEALEALRLREVRKILDAASGEQRLRLEGLQWQIDMTREGSRSPIAACIRISEMMWRNILGEDGLIDTLASLTSTAEADPGGPESAVVLSFDRPAEDDAGEE